MSVKWSDEFGERREKGREGTNWEASLSSGGGGVLVYGFFVLWDIF
jgi:hypothetical protein